MFSVALCIFILFIVWDIHILKRRDAALFNTVFRTGRWLVVLYLAAIILFAIFLKEWWEVEESFILFFVFPLYFYKRHLFMRQVAEEPRFAVAASALQTILYWLFGVLLISTFFYACNNKWGDLEEMIISGAISSVLLVWLIEKNAPSLGKAHFWENIGFVRRPVSFGRKIFIPALLGVAMGYFSATIIVERGVQPDTPLNKAMGGPHAAWTIPAFIFLALIVAPFVEEITFRGYFFEVLKRLKGQRLAFYVIALTFGALHMAQYWGDWMAITVIMIMGFVLTGLRVFAGTTAASVTTHYFYNASVVIIATLMEAAKGLL